VDTTAAGDTFTGYFFASVAEGRTVEEALAVASRAAGIAVTRPGAAASIPFKNEI
jgi:ribokinase